MAERVSSSHRVRMQSVAEREVMRYRGQHARWHKHVHNVELDAAQVLKMLEMDRSRNTLDFSCRRTGKTAVKEMYLLEHQATEADQELGIVAPREAQALVNLGYHLDAIRRSPILSAWLAYKSGRTQLADTYYQFANRSVARAYGVMAQVDGGDMTAASLEEIDDMPRERLYSRFLLMMGSTRRLGASQNSQNDPQIRITGVFKGADTLAAMVAGGQYKVLPTVNVHLGIQMGILNETFMDQMRADLSPDEYIRQLLCVNIESRNLIWERHVRRAMHVGLASGLQLAGPLPGARYGKRGLLGFGYDASGHGEAPEASRHAFVVVEQIGNFLCFPYARTWSPGTDDQVVKRDLLGLWEYFRPDAAFGDAYGVGMLTQLNDELFSAGLVDLDRRTIGEGQSTASTWSEWPFAPLRFEGMTKHSMATALRAAFHAGQAALPYVDDLDLHDPQTADLRLLVRQLTNIKPVVTKTSYASYKMADPKLGDDLFDAAMAATWALVTRGAAQAPGMVLLGKRSRQNLLGTELEVV